MDVPLYGDYTLKGRYFCLDNIVIYPDFFSSKTSLSSSCPIILDKSKSTTDAEDPTASFQGDHIGILLEVWGYDLDDLQNPLRKQITSLNPEQGLYFKLAKPLQPTMIEIFLETQTNHNLAVRLKIATQTEIIETETKTVKIFHSTEAPSTKRSAKEYEQEWMTETH